MVIVVLPLGRTLRCEFSGLLWDNIVSLVSMTSLLKKLGEAIADHYKIIKGVLSIKIRKDRDNDNMVNGWVYNQN